MTLSTSWPNAPRTGDLDAFAREKKKQKQSLNKELDSKSSGGSSGGPKKDDDKERKERKRNIISQTEAAEKIKDRYESTGQQGKYRLRGGKKGVKDISGKEIKRFEWDGAHNDWEGYTTKEGKQGSHSGSFDPYELKPYKDGIPGRKVQ
jgi:hypothetical protein